MENNKNLVVRINDDLHKQLKVYCAEKKISIRDFITNLITNELKKTDERT